LIIINSVNPADAMVVLGADPPSQENPVLLAFAAERDGDFAGLAVAESHPGAVHAFGLEGEPDACCLLLARLVRAAGERDVSVRCPADRPEVPVILEAMGFTRQCPDEPGERPSHLYLRPNSLSD